MSLAEIELDRETRRRIRRRYREQMKRWCPPLVQSDAPAATKGLMVMMTHLWERRGRGRKPKPPRPASRRRSRWKEGGYGVYDLRVLRRLGDWIRRELTFQGGM